MNGGLTLLYDWLCFGRLNGMIRILAEGFVSLITNARVKAAAQGVEVCPFRSQTAEDGRRRGWMLLAQGAKGISWDELR